MPDIQPFVPYGVSGTGDSVIRGCHRHSADPNPGPPHLKRDLESSSVVMSGWFYMQAWPCQKELVIAKSEGRQSHTATNAGLASSSQSCTVAVCDSLQTWQ